MHTQTLKQSREKTEAKLSTGKKVPFPITQLKRLKALPDNSITLMHFPLETLMFQHSLGSIFVASFSSLRICEKITTVWRESDVLCIDLLCAHPRIQILLRAGLQEFSDLLKIHLIEIRLQSS